MLRSYLVPLGLLFFCACSKPDNPTPVPPPPPITDSVPAKPDPSTDTTHWKIVNTGINAFLWDIWFTDSLHGVMTGADSMLYRSSDGGQTWKQAISFRSDLQCLYFLNAKQGFVAGILNFGYTLDGGQTWTIKKIQGTLIDTVRSSPQGYFFPWPNLQFVSGSTGYLTTGKGLYMTTDTGSTWTIVNTHPVHAVYFTSATDGYAYYASALIARTGDGGATWQPGVTVPIPSSYNGGNTSLDLLQFTDAEHGWYFAGVNISRTIDGGQTWQLLQNFQTQGYADFQMLSNQLGYICGTTIKKTTDGGNTWQTVADLGTARAVSLFMLDANHGWVCGTNGLVLRFHP